MPKRDIDQICEIAARLTKDAGVLRSLGLHAAADLLQAAESDLDSRVYGDDCGGDIVCNNIAYERPRRQRRQKGREVRTH
ncbi:MAG: hypothetical protein ACJ8D0_22455 [Xanthobacteraceae bacterium]